MRLLRLVLAIAICVPAVFLLLVLVVRTSSRVATTATGNFRALLDWRSPSSLFPPSAIISLTDDNSTFFLARPANFGPLLPADGLSGQLWIGSGFGEDDLSGGIASAEGELGCSDVPGWDHGDRGSPAMRNGDTSDRDSKSKPSDMQESRHKDTTMRRRSTSKSPRAKRPTGPHRQDGTDDHLHHPLPSSSDPKSRKNGGGHADIQSIQESAEIAGKVVLLSRGGCGFLEKVKWVQRRGGTALIVGDNVRGGLLVTMYARGDTSNVTIPAVFTSHTTAHLLSSLIPSGSRSGRFSLADAKRLGLVMGSDGLSQPESSSSATSKNEAEEKVDKDQQDGSGWLRFMFSKSKSPFPEIESRRPPSSGNVDWILQEDFDQDARGQDTKAKRPAKSSAQGRPARPAEDGFLIGVHDWRDPDLVEFNKLQAQESASTSATYQSPGKASAKVGTSTPGMGIYAEQTQTSLRASSTAQYSSPQTTDEGVRAPSDEELEEERIARLSYYAGEMAKAQMLAQKEQKGQASKPHEGLWVTLQPTTMSTSPFFDTLLVLVVSPLVTLTVVYALLLLRSRIRRRRWRAPKSVVERLPVRTYHTITSPSATTSGSQVSSLSTAQTPDQTTPLLQSVARPIRQRPRSKTTGEVPIPGSSTGAGASLTLDQIQEKREAGLREWRRKYGGLQKECVVCLEEYVDGISQVMSLPCGHEFHAECM